MNCFTKKIRFEKPGYLKFEFVGDKRILPTCVISALEAKRLLLKGCESYLAHVVDTSVTEIKLENVPVVVTPQIRDVTGQRQPYTYASEALTY